jgi:hypothetical protein
MTVAELANAPSGSYVVDAFATREDLPCPPCPPRVNCTPCRPPIWRITDALDASSPKLVVGDETNRLASGGRYRLRVQVVGRGLAITAILDRLAAPPSGFGDACDACLQHRIEWGILPGLAPSTTYGLAPCRAFSRSVTGVETPTSCSATAACEPSIGWQRIVPYLSSTDVTGALARSPIVFGRDVRAVDGAMFRIAIDGKEILLGPDCDGQAGCPAAPAGVMELAATLRAAQIVTTDDRCQAP